MSRVVGRVVLCSLEANTCKILTKSKVPSSKYLREVLAVLTSKYRFISKNVYGSISDKILRSHTTVLMCTAGNTREFPQ